MKSQKLAKLALPDAPGVYTFRDEKKRPLYIGRATSLRNRVRSYFGVDLIDTRGPRIVDMVTKAATVTWEETDSVLEAVLLESELIKRYQPYYNVDERDDKSSLYVIITDEDWPRVFLERARDYDHYKKEGSLEYKVRKCFGPFPETGIIKESLKILRKLFPFRDKKSKDTKHQAFYAALGWSPDDSKEAKAAYQKTIEYMVLFFEGRKKRLKTAVKREMNTAAREMRFEDANRAKKLYYALDHINDIALIKHEKRSGGNKAYRIEAYDIAHLAGMETVGVMVVSVGGDLANGQYRKFKISKNQNDDIAGLAETLFRRLNHPEWPYPDLIVVDGNENQVKSAEGILKVRRISIPVVGVTKDERHKADRLVGNPDIVKQYKKDIIALNAEAHRFAIAYHRKRREMGMF